MLTLTETARGCNSSVLVCCAAVTATACCVDINCSHALRVRVLAGAILVPHHQTGACVIFLHFPAHPRLHLNTRQSQLHLGARVVAMQSSSVGAATAAPGVARAHALIVALANLDVCIVADDALLQRICLLTAPAPAPATAPMPAALDDEATQRTAAAQGGPRPCRRGGSCPLLRASLGLSAVDDLLGGVVGCGDGDGDDDGISGGGSRRYHEDEHLERGSDDGGHGADASSLLCDADSSNSILNDDVAELYPVLDLGSASSPDAAIVFIASTGTAVVCESPLGGGFGSSVESEASGEDDDEVAETTKSAASGDPEEEDRRRSLTWLDADELSQRKAFRAKLQALKVPAPDTELEHHAARIFMDSQDRSVCVSCPSV